MKKLSQPVYLKIDTQEKLEALQFAIEMSHDVTNDMVLDATVMHVKDLSKLVLLNVSEQRENLIKRTAETNEAIDRLLAVTALKNDVDSLVNLQKD